MHGYVLLCKHVRAIRFIFWKKKCYQNTDFSRHKLPNEKKQMQKNIFMKCSLVTDNDGKCKQCKVT